MGDILFIGGDRRMICAAELISQSGGVCAVGLGGDFPEPENQSGGYERIVLPVPFSRDGENITAPLSERLRRCGSADFFRRNLHEAGGAVYNSRASTGELHGGRRADA